MKYYDFVNYKDIVIDNCTIDMLPTTHTDKLDSFGVMFSDEYGSYYYTGDTNDIEFVKKMSYDSNIKRIYCECSWESYGAHIDHKELLTLNKDKFVLMHFEDMKLCEYMQSQGFTVATKE